MLILILSDSDEIFCKIDYKTMLYSIKCLMPRVRCWNLES